MLENSGNARNTNRTGRRGRKHHQGVEQIPEKDGQARSELLALRGEYFYRRNVSMRAKTWKPRCNWIPACELPLNGSHACVSSARSSFAIPRKAAVMVAIMNAETKPESFDSVIFGIGLHATRAIRGRAEAIAIDRERSQMESLGAAGDLSRRSPTE